MLLAPSRFSSASEVISSAVESRMDCTSSGDSTPAISCQKVWLIWASRADSEEEYSQTCQVGQPSCRVRLWPPNGPLRGVMCLKGVPTSMGLWQKSQVYGASGLSLSATVTVISTGLPFLVVFWTCLVSYSSVSSLKTLVRFITGVFLGWPVSGSITGTVA